MKTAIPRRAFLSGAASLLGVPALGATAMVAPGGGAVAGLSVYFWNGEKFVPLGQASGTPHAVASIQVQIVELAGSPNPAEIAFALPGGTFQAYSGTPTGPGTASFRAPFSTAGISLSVSQGTATQSYVIGERSLPGYYLFVPAMQSVSSLFLVPGPTPTVLGENGATLPSPTILIQLS